MSHSPSTRTEAMSASVSNGSRFATGPGLASQACRCWAPSPCPVTERDSALASGAAEPAGVSGSSSSSSSSLLSSEPEDRSVTSKSRSCRAQRMAAERAVAPRGRRPRQGTRGKRTLPFPPARRHPLSRTTQESRVSWNSWPINAWETVKNYGSGLRRPVYNETL